MKQGWEIKEFEDCLEKVVYTNKIQRKDFLEVGDYPIISQEQDFINGYWDNSDDLFKVKKPIVIFGDHTQVLKYVDFDFVLGADGVKILQPKNNIDPRFFYYFLQNINLGSLGYARHYRLLKEIEVSYPKSLPEQQRIVAILDEAFAAIAKAKTNAEQNLKNAKELFESYLQGVFENKGEGWEEKRLGDVCSIGDGNYSSKYPKASEFVSEGIPFLTATNLKNGTVIPEGIRFISKEQHSTLTKGHIIKGDLVIVVRGSIGNNSIVPIEYAGSNLNSQLAFLRVIENTISSEYLFAVFNSPPVMKTVKAAISGAAQPQLPNNKLLDIKISYPTIKEQQTIVQKLDALSTETKKLEAIYQQKINDLEELKKSVLQKAFSGELKTVTAVV
jgi:type I restriction enzyme S subunit